MRLKLQLRCRLSIRLAFGFKSSGCGRLNELPAIVRHIVRHIVRLIIRLAFGFRNIHFGRITR